MIATRLEYSNLIMIDNGASIIPMLGNDGDDLTISIWDSVFYGETDAKECPAKDACSEFGVDLQGPGVESASWKVFCYKRSAIMLSMMTSDHKPPIIPSTITWP